MPEVDLGGGAAPLVEAVELVARFGGGVLLRVYATPTDASALVASSATPVLVLWRIVVGWQGKAYPSTMWYAV